MIIKDLKCDCWYPSSFQNTALHPNYCIDFYIYLFTLYLWKLDTIIRKKKKKEVVCWIISLKSDLKFLTTQLCFLRQNKKCFIWVVRSSFMWCFRRLFRVSEEDGFLFSEVPHIIFRMRWMFLTPKYRVYQFAGIGRVALGWVSHNIPSKQPMSLAESSVLF